AGGPLEITLAIAPAVCTALGVWLGSRNGRKVRIKIGDIEAEAQTREDVEALLARAQEIQKQIAQRKEQPKQIQPYAYLRLREGASTGRCILAPWTRSGQTLRCALSEIGLRLKHSQTIWQQLESDGATLNCRRRAFVPGPNILHTTTCLSITMN